MTSRERAQEMLAALIEAARAEARREALEEAADRLLAEALTYGPVAYAYYRQAEKTIRALKEKP